ncbi:phage RecT family protein [Streptococcus equi subsp. equi]|nr:phage RecT family protein [Streptococcus equi subsp. equi]CRS38883.1 phage RecT family protein [Streptococcus equi subsp. equi]
MANQLAHKDFFNAPVVQKKFSEVLGNNSTQFIASLLGIVNNSDLLAKASNESIMTAAMTAATLKLPIQQSLGYAYIVPYKGQAQFQLGYKGLIQLAQ